MSACAVSLFGNVRECRTEAEISYELRGSTSEVIAVVWEDDGGWQVDVFDQRLAVKLGSSFEAAVEDAKRRLQSYVNRRGTNPPEGLTVAGLSLWLMLKDDGTAMGKPYPA